MASAYARKKNAQEKRLNAKFRRLVLERDNYRCVLTGTPEDKENGITLEVHHVLGRVGCLKFWNPDGAISLAWIKHQKLHHGTDEERAEIQQEIENYFGPEKWAELILLKNQLFFEKDEFTEEHLNELAKERGIPGKREVKLQYKNFEIVASPHIINATCKCGERMREVSNGWFSSALFCPKCENVYVPKLVKVPDKKVDPKFIEACRMELENEKPCKQ